MDNVTCITALLTQSTESAGFLSFVPLIITKLFIFLTSSYWLITTNLTNNWSSAISRLLKKI